MDEGKDRVKTDRIDRDISGKDSDEIRESIEATICEIDATVDALQDRLSPRHLMDALGSTFAGGLRDVGSGKLIEAVRRHPVPAALIGVGALWLISNKGRRFGREEGRGSDEDWLDLGATYSESPGAKVKGTAGRIGHEVAHAKDRVVSAASDAAEVARQRMHNAADGVRHARDVARDKMHHMSDTARHQVEHAGELAQKARRSFWDTFEDNPLAIAGAAIAAGVILGMLVPSTRREDELMGQTRDDLVRSAKELGKEAMEGGKQVARSVVQTAREETGIPNVEPRTIAEKARQVAGRVIETAKEEVREQSRTIAERATEQRRL